MENSDHKRRVRHRRARILMYILGGAGAGAFIVGALLTNIFERKQEGRSPFYRVVELDDKTDDPEVWGRNFPLQYDGYRRTVDQIRTRFGGSEAVPRAPTKADPRSVVAQSKLDEDPRLKIIWAGYAFSKDFREERGHAFMLDDQNYTERQQASPQPGTCLHCHGSVYVPYLKLGKGDLTRGFELMNQMTYTEARAHVNHPVACIDCHDPKSMQLRVTRPAFMEGIAAVKTKEGLAAYDVNKSASRQEMRTFVCAQCHDEYYFKGPEKRLTYPWANGLKIEEIYAYYEKNGHKDWTHKVTGAPMLKAQHPEFELWSQGIHARSGVSCADCHMPYKREGAMKVSDHHVRSPVLNLQRACQTCHHVPEAELKARVESIQDRTFRMRNLAMDAVIDLINDIAAARKSGATEKDLGVALKEHRAAEFYLDFVEAENSTGFHAPAEAVRILGESINHSRLGQVSLRNTRGK